MKLIYRIARLELSTLFYSPIAWLVLIIFTVQTGIKFTDLLEMWEGYQQRGTTLSNLTSSIFSGSNPDYYLFPAVKNNLYLYIPLLTMGLISRELSSGSIKLLLSSPVNFSQIVLGKYLAMVIYSFILCVVLGMHMIAGGYTIVSFDYQLVLSGIAGLFLLICSYSAIGLFISSLTSYQVVAAIGTFAAIALLNFIGDLWQDVPVINEIVYWLSMSGRADQMIKGLISSKGLLYFFIVMLLFVTLTILKLSSGKQSRSFAAKTAYYGAAVVITLVAGYITSRPSLTLYHDVTATQNQTLTPESQEVVNLLKDRPLKITSYVNIFSNMAGRSGLPKYHNQNFRQIEDYVRFLPHLEMDYIYFYDTIPSNPNIYKDNPGLTERELAQKVAASYSINFEKVLSPEEIKEVVDLSSVGNQYVRQIQYNGEKAFLTMFNDIRHYPSQEEISAALKRLIAPLQKVAFVKGHGERTLAKNDRDYNSATIVREDNRRSLINKGFDIITISLEKYEIQDDISILVIADPKSAFTQQEIEKVTQYIDGGGNLLVMVEPDNRIYMDSIMTYLDIAFLPGKLKQKSKDFLPDFILGKVPERALMLSPLYSFKNYVEREYPVSMPSAMGLVKNKDCKFKVTPLIVTNKNTINELNGTGTDEVYTLTSFSDQHKGELPLALALQRKVGDKEQRIIVVGDADFMSNVEYLRSNVNTINRRAFIPNLFRWLSNDEFSVNTEYPPGMDNRILIDTIGVRWLRIIFLGILPGLILTLGAVILITRRGK